MLSVPFPAAKNASHLVYQHAFQHTMHLPCPSCSSPLPPSHTHPPLVRLPSCRRQLFDQYIGLQQVLEQRLEVLQGQGWPEVRISQ